MAALDFHILLEELGIKATDDSLYETAFTHASYRNENQRTCLTDYDRLEFIGDAVLDLVIGDFIYHRFPEMNSGELSRCRSSLVMGATESKFSEKLEFGKYIRVSKGETMSGPIKPKILEDVFESFIGAYYLDNRSDFEKVRKFVCSFFADALENYKAYEEFDYKSKLQDLIQGEIKGDIVYVTTAERGNANEKEFDVQVTCNGIVLGTGTGSSKKRAEQQAAKNAMEKKVG